jgi:GMP synthase-like glutamine amidotransferase
VAPAGKRSHKEVDKKENQGTGLCLGARLIASNHGAQVYRFVDETGDFPVHRKSGVKRSPATVPDSLCASQIHSGTFEMQEGENLLSTQDLLRNEGSRLKPLPVSGSILK